MAKINKAYTFSPNTTISSSQMNSDMDTLYTEFNGAISSANFATGGITTAKITDANVTTAKFADGAITTSKINADAVTAAKIDWVGFGADTGIWWEELGRTTLGSGADTITVGTFTGKKYLMVMFYVIDTGGTITGQMRFGNAGSIDSGANYSNRSSTNGAADATSVSQTGLITDAGALAAPQFGVYNILNVATQEKIVIGGATNRGTAGAGNIPNRREFVGKWANTTNPITDVNIYNTGAGDFATGSEVVVLGHN